jgi:hypothetical protein
LTKIPGGLVIVIRVGTTFCRSAGAQNAALGANLVEDFWRDEIKENKTKDATAPVREKRIPTPTNDFRMMLLLLPNYAELE